MITYPDNDHSRSEPCDTVLSGQPVFLFSFEHDAALARVRDEIRFGLSLRYATPPPMKIITDVS